MLDAVISGQEREIYQIIGKGVSEDPDQNIPMTDNNGLMLPSSAANRARVPCIKTIRPTRSSCRSRANAKSSGGEDEENNFVILAPFDVASVTLNLMRGFRNVGDEEGLLLGIYPGRMRWRDDVLAKATKRGRNKAALKKLKKP